MNTQIPDDPFSGIQIPQLKQVTQLGDSFGEQAVSVQIDVNETQLPVFNGSDRTTKRPMKPPTDTVSGSVSSTDAFIGDAVEAVGTDGKLNKVTKHSTWVTPSVTAYPTYLRTRNVAGAVTKNVTLDSNGIEIDNGNGQTVRMFFADFTKNIQFREMDVCDGGVTKKILVLCSLPYV